MRDCTFGSSQRWRGSSHFWHVWKWVIYRKRKWWSTILGGTHGYPVWRETQTWILEAMWHNRYSCSMRKSASSCKIHEHVQFLQVINQSVAEMEYKTPENWLPSGNQTWQEKIEKIPELAMELQFAKLSIYVWLVVSNICYFHNIWDNPSHWLIFFKMVKTTNQISSYKFEWCSIDFPCVASVAIPSW